MSTESQLERILEAKNAQGLTNQQFADLVGINKSTVYRIFGGKVTPDSQTIDLMEQALGISDTPPVEPEIIDQRESDTIRNLLKIQDRRWPSWGPTITVPWPKRTESYSASASAKSSSLCC